MKLNNLFFVIPFLFVVVVIGLFLSGKIETVIFNSLLYGFIIATLNFLSGIISLRYGLEKSDKIFLIIVFGGLILRLFIVFSLIIITINFLFVRLNSFIFITFIFYFYYLIIEIYILSQKKNIKIKTNND